jgi:citrate lyase beta subunit
VVTAYEEATARGQGAVAVGGKMIDAANIRMATTTLCRADAIAART